MDEITVHELKQKIENGDGVFILDVREVFEKYQSDIAYENKTLISLGQLPNKLDELSEFKETEIVCMCRSGSRSAKACEYLSDNGFSDVKNLKGGINQWAKEIDTSLPVY